MRVGWAVACLVVAACGGDELCEGVPSLAGRTASVDLSGAPAYLDRVQLMAATDAALAAYGVTQGDASSEITIRWGELQDAGWLAVTIDRHAIVFSPDVAWSVDGCEDRDGYDVTTALEHELGHVAGLGHSKTGLMAPKIGMCTVIDVCGPDDVAQGGDTVALAPQAYR